MGAAKRRGTFEQRRDKAIERIEEEDAAIAEDNRRWRTARLSTRGSIIPTLAMFSAAAITKPAKKVIIVDDFKKLTLDEKFRVLNGEKI